MSLYYRNLKKIGIGMVLASLGNLIYELLIRRFMAGGNAVYASYIPLEWGIWTKGLIGVTAGAVALFFHWKKKHYRVGTLILIFLCIAEAAVIVLSMTGTPGRRTNGLIDLTMLVMVILTYTFTQTDRDLDRWMRISQRQPAVLDLRLRNPVAFFNTIQAGPQMVINEKYASVVTRFLASAGPVPLQINLLCSTPVSEPMRDTMREVLAMYYEMEEKRLRKILEKKYHRIILLFVVSLISIGILRQFTLLNDQTVVWDVMGNFAAFGLWQIGYIHYERNEDFDRLLLVHCAKFAKLNFVDKKEAQA